MLDLTSRQTLAPSRIIVVDASDTVQLPLVHAEATIVHAEPGLPHQRQIGLESASAKGADFAVFLDDDVEFQDDFLERLIAVVVANPGDLVGTNDELITSRKQLFFFPRRVNWLSRGGLAHLGRVPDAVEEVGWVPGFCMAGSTADFLAVGFPTEIRMLTEDIVFQVRFRARGRILLAPNLGLIHRSDPRGRISKVQSTLVWDYMRLRMVESENSQFSIFQFFLEVLMLSVADLARLRSSSLGHLLFVARILLGRRRIYDFRSA